MSNLKQNYSLPDGTLKPIRKPARDPLIIQMEKAYRGSWKYQLDKLLKVEERYRRRESLARAGLDKTRKQIVKLLGTLAEPHLAEPARKETK